MVEERQEDGLWVFILALLLLLVIMSPLIYAIVVCWDCGCGGWPLL